MMHPSQDRGRRIFASLASGSRLIAAAALCLAMFALLPSAPSTAAPSRAAIDRAEQQLAALQNKQSALDEQYNLASYQLARAQTTLLRAQAALGKADTAHQSAVAQLTQTVRAAYELGPGSELEALFGSGSLSVLSDRAQFLDGIVTNDQSVALQAASSGQVAQRAAARLQRAAAARASAVMTLATKKAALDRSVAQQRALVDGMKASLRRAILARQARRRRQLELLRQRLARAAGGFTPPPNATQVQIAIDAAESQLGVPYIYADAQPGVGFDCSGLTMWAWGLAGVSLPHVAALQYAMLPHVSRSQLRPGDLVFFYHPIDHVGIYIGNGMMIDAPHTGAFVEETGVYWSIYAGAARP
jgi:peptidoglycan DL-endopeptidase CwlO